MKGGIADFRRVSSRLFRSSENPTYSALDFRTFGDEMTTKQKACPIADDRRSLTEYVLRFAGDVTVWNALSSLPSHSDIAASFAKTIRETGDASLAVTSAFYQWYACPDRMERYYLTTCSDYLDRQDAATLFFVIR